MEPTLQQIASLARGAGEILRAGYEKEHEVNYKGVIDLVTEIDRQSETYLLGEIQRLFPDHHILTEESGEIKGRDESLWYIDPLDGTVNYAHGIPVFSVSIAYASRGTLKLGAVYDPMRDELFLAEKGGGAHLNGRALHPSTVDDLQRSLMVTGFPYDAWNTEHDNFANFVKMAKRTQGVRRLGSAALDASYVGAGRFDAFWELSLKPWDVAAGGLIAREAGAIVTNMRGQPDFLASPLSIVAAGPGIHAKLLEALGES